MVPENPYLDMDVLYALEVDAVFADLNSGFVANANWYPSTPDCLFTVPDTLSDDFLVTLRIAGVGR